MINCISPSENIEWQWRRRKPTAIDLFCGCGGLTQGLKEAGFKVIGAVDIDWLAIETYKSNHKLPHIWESDIRSVAVTEVMKTLQIEQGELDLLAGCPPCQGFSSLRTFNGGRKIKDPRNDLVFEFLRFARGLRPQVVMMENVPSLARDIRIKHMCAALTKLGYHCSVTVVDAADYGVPQRRRRMMLLAGLRKPVELAPIDRSRRTVRDYIACLPPPGESGDALHDFPENRSRGVLELIRRIPKDGGSRLSLPRDKQLECHRNTDGFKDVYGRLAWNELAPTITSGCTNPSKGRFLHPEQDRALTLREAALLQSFSPKYKFSLSRGKGPASVLIGNALPPELIRRHAKHIKKNFLAPSPLIKQQ